MSRADLLEAAKTLSDVIEKMDQTKLLLSDAYAILRPILDDALNGKINTYGSLPHRKFFFGMYEDSLPAHYLGNTELINAVSAFDDTWRAEAK